MELTDPLREGGRDADDRGFGHGGRYTRALVALTRVVWHERCTLDDALAEICRTAADALDVPRVNVWQYDADRRQLRCLHDYEQSTGRHVTDAAALETLSLADSDYIASLEVVRAIDADDVESDPSTARSVGALREYLKRHHIRSLLDAPVLAEGRLVGVICHEQVGGKRAWTADDVTFAGSMGDYVAMAIEVQRRREAEQALSHLRLHDAATNLPNREYLVELLGIRLQASAQAVDDGQDAGVVHLQAYLPYAAALSAGARTFDENMAAIAACLRQALGEGYNLARARADAFAVLPRFPQPEREVVKLAERCVDLVRRLSDESGLEIGAAAGVAFARDLLVRDARTLLRNAELASAHARGAGRYRYEVFDIGHHRELFARLHLEQALREALAHDRFSVLYQPEVDLATGAWTGAEALLRWQRDGALVAAGEFIEAAESSGLILPLGRWVLAQACQEARRWGAGARAPVLRVNVSALQFETRTLVDDVAAALEGSGLAPERLCLEVTETTLLRDAVQAAATMHRLRSLGVRVAIDDFGTGHASFAYLKRFPVDVLKIDRGFVAGLPDDRLDAAVVRAIAGIARDIGVEVVAEGVETRAQADALLGAGIVQAQGWLYAPALEAGALRARFGQDAAG